MMALLSIGFPVPAAPRASILHLATHAEANDRDPLASHLRLAASEGHDGYLHLAEAAQLSAPARLVVLTGCETLAGPLYRGSGLMGLARAFLAGGARAIVATHWPVGGTAASVAGDFHKRLAAIRMQQIPSSGGVRAHTARARLSGCVPRR